MTDLNTQANARRPSFGANAVKPERSNSSSSRRTSFHVPETERPKMENPDAVTGDGSVVEEECKKPKLSALYECSHLFSVHSQFALKRAQHYSGEGGALLVSKLVFSRIKAFCASLMRCVCLEKGER